MNQSPTAKKPKTWLVTAILCSAAVAYVYLVFLPGQRAVAAIRAQLKEKQQFILQAERLTASIEQTQREVDAAAKFTEQWRAVAPSEARLSVLFGEISDQAKLAGTDVVQFDPEPIERFDAVWRMNVTVGFEGDYRQAFDFVSRIEQLNQVVWVDELSLSPASVARTDESEDTQLLHGQLMLTIFADNHDISD